MPAKKKSKTTYRLNPGSAYHLESGDNWQYSGGGAWNTVMVPAAVASEARYVGERWVDSEKMAVFKTLEGYFAQTAAFARCASGGKKRHGVKIKSSRSWDAVVASNRIDTTRWKDAFEVWGWTYGEHNGWFVLGAPETKMERAINKAKRYVAEEINGKAEIRQHGKTVMRFPVRSGGKKRHTGGDSGDSEFDAGHAAGQKQAKKDARAEKDLWAIRQNLPHGSDYDLGFSVGYEIIAKDVAGPRGGVPVGHYGWVSGRESDVKFTPKGGGFASSFTGPHAIEKMRYHLRNARNIPTMDVNAALPFSRDLSELQKALKK